MVDLPYLKFYIYCTAANKNGVYLYSSKSSVENSVDFRYFTQPLP